MGLQAGKDYAARDIQAAVRSVTDDQTLTVTFHTFDDGNVTLVINGTQLTTSLPVKGGKIKWAKDIQDLISDAIGRDDLDWSGS